MSHTSAHSPEESDMKHPRDITISLGELTARTGDIQIIYRVSADDKVDIDTAANRLNMSTSQFLRMVTIQAARKVVAEVV
jgi:predicted DNA-binding protein (UPF0251 family)